MDHALRIVRKVRAAANYEQADFRILSNDEIAEVWNACEPLDGYSCVVRLLLITGQRRGEVGGMRWSELDSEQQTWTIPGTRTKNKRPHVVPLSLLAWRIVEQVHPRLGVDHLFGRGKHGLGGWSRNAETMKKRMRPLPPWTVHDLRRTVATRMSDLSVQPHIVEQVLNHQTFKRGVSGTYNRSPYAFNSSPTKS
jgi:integrase